MELKKPQISFQNVFIQATTEDNYWDVSII